MNSHSLVWILTFAALWILTSCKEVDIQPEVKSIEYQEIQRAKASVAAALASESKVLLDQLKGRREAAPQTADGKIFDKRLWATQSRVDRLKQEAEYLELVSQSTKWKIRKSYLARFNSGNDAPAIKPPDIEPIRRLRNVRKDWSGRSRVAEYREANHLPQLVEPGRKPAQAIVTKPNEHH